MREEKRIYVVIPSIVETRTGYVRQPKGRQIAQACHVVSKLRHLNVGMMFPEIKDFEPVTTIILQARASRNMVNAWLKLRKWKPVLFSDENEEAYGNFKPITAMAVYARPSQVKDILGGFPLWGS